MLKIDKIDMMILSELSNDASVSIPKISKSNSAHVVILASDVFSYMLEAVICSAKGGKD